MSVIAVLNAGSSSIKFAAYNATDEALLFRGQIEGIGLEAQLKLRDAGGTVLDDRSWANGTIDHAGATREIVGA
ncbi:MAG: acetate kinase, partial [Proteobacteria bacterium]|nr:acetate kinase [Pseudomonadota bacterium]